MQITFLGTGEACDSDHYNSSILLEVGKTACLLDCGFTAAHTYFATQSQNELGTIWISHFHGDHFFGLPLLLLRLYQAGRKEPLSLASGVDASHHVTALMELAYPGLLDKLPFELEYVVLSPGVPHSHGNIEWQTAEIQHGKSGYGIRLEVEGKSLYYSGDGKPTPAALALMERVDLVIHEAFTLEVEYPGHFTVASCLKMSEEVGCKQLALIHLSRELRSDDRLRSLLQTKDNVILPEDGDRLIL